jgi:hypothetical protein
LYIGYGTLNKAIQSQTGFLFESDNIACAPAAATFNIGTTFSVSAWVYLTDLTTEQTIWCKEMIHASNAVTHRACVKIKTGTIWAGVNNDTSTNTGTYLEVDSTVSPLKGWNMIVVAFDVSGGVSRATTWVRKPDGTSVNGAAKAFTITFQDSASFMMCVGA